MTDIIKRMLVQAAGDYPNETCGVVLRKREAISIFPCRNISESPREQFTLCPIDLVEAMRHGEVIAWYHSHPDGVAAASEADRAACERTGLPWYIVSYPAGRHTMIEPCGYKAPLIGRPFVHGIHDCYALARDYYAKRGITLAEFEREDKWWEKGLNLYLDNYASQGFIEVQNLKAGDALLMQIRSPVPNHTAIYVGDGTMLHHLHGRLSGRLTYDDFYQERTTHILRHASLC